MCCFKQLQEWLEMGKKEENTHFTCINCFQKVLPLQNGSYRNHCPFCLVSVHVDDVPGDRKNRCNGVMFPSGLIHKKGKGWQIVHTCTKCGCEKRNKIADGTVQPDDWEVIIRLSTVS
jgi:hypothetical protein